ncbi:ABC transporter permease [Flavobacteriaceae bacterium]|jgi:ABC-2 type transport system permease protein|nr:ABC transporter permease [Flavobacteriaceae bacterium]MDA9846673.1 ABC transporter permease [Flavobacteriaceae bacterium]MDC3274971.1 ABC transporter permease [Flavobacteriaceae bacterium]
MNHLPLIIKREYLAKVKNKSFILMTFLSPLFIVALLSLIAYLTSVNNEKVRTISVLDESGILSEAFISSDQILYESLNGMDLEDAKTTSNSNKAYGLLHVPDLALEDVSEKIKFYSKESPSLSLISSLESKIEKRIGELKLKKMGVDLSKISASKTYVNINQEDFEGVKTSKAGSFLKLIFGAAAGYLLFMFIIIYGNLIMRSVIEEKSSRIIEVIISSVKPIQLMLGKIFGTSLAGITQFAIWVILIAILSFAASNFFGIDLSANPQQEMMTAAVSDVNANSELQALIAELHSLPLINLIVAFVLFFVGGYLLYSSLYAAIGAAVDNETDTQQFLMPVVILLVVGFYVGFFTALEDPHGTISVVFSYIPFTSPIVMLIRIPFGVPIWEQILSLSVLIFSFLVTVWIAAKIYRVGILMHGKKPSYKDLIKWLKY